MNPFDEIRNAALGLLDLLGARPDTASRFNATRQGLLTMLGVYFILVVLTRVIQSLALFGSVPGIEDLLVTLAVNALPLLAIFLVIFVTVRFLRPQAGLLAFLVPAGYALCAILVIGLPLSLFAGGMSSSVLQGILGYMLYRLARDTGKFGIGVSIGFAVLSLLLLAAIPLGLYMLMQPELPTPD